ncbi:DNA binding protein [Mycobacterium phage Curiosium]|uniref:DNA binding protein n=1 Tax=Mycobacterium phage Curiosium TaxID=2599859 RepID=A0A5J6TW35_9CAUD|nr:DNA binding protein [Mycobacterium phage Curiosium]QFG14137.1 DNA binding protein [Mycobacterium phage Curiosium]
MSEAVIELKADRQHGLTTALLDVALANARRGDRVIFWSPSSRESADAFQQSRHLLDPHDPQVSRVCAANGNQYVAYDRGGRVQFVWGRSPEDVLCDTRTCGAAVYVFDDNRGSGAHIVRRNAMRDLRDRREVRFF